MRAPSKAIPSWPASAALLASGLALSAPTVTPSGPAVPENLLRIEVRLDRPLAAPLDMAHVALLDSSGMPVQGAFLDLPLPDVDGRSWTLLLHPGRIKRGVGPNIALGPALRSGGSVTLRIDDPRIGAPLTRRWQVAPALHQRIDPQQWSPQPVHRGSRQPLRVTVPAALDAAAQALIAVQGPGKQRFPGIATLAKGEHEWRFTPARPWRPGTYLLRIHPRLEDPQGNRLCSAFEEVRQGARQCDEEGRLAFTVD